MPLLWFKHSPLDFFQKSCIVTRCRNWFTCDIHRIVFISEFMCLLHLHLLHLGFSHAILNSDFCRFILFMVYFLKKWWWLYMSLTFCDTAIINTSLAMSRILHRNLSRDKEGRLFRLVSETLFIQYNVFLFPLFLYLFQQHSMCLSRPPSFPRMITFSL